jgi:hypothetical protein
VKNYDHQYQEYIEIARKELEYPTFALTKQHLEVLDLKLENGVPSVARIKQNVSNNIIAIYFPVKDENFYLVVNISMKSDKAVQFIWVESGHRVYLTATSETLNYNELSAFLKLKPLTGWSKGELRRNKYPYTFSCVSYEPNQNEAYGLEEKLIELLGELEKDSEGVKNLVQNADAVISICRHQYISGNAGIHFDVKTIKRLHTLNLPIDIDVYIVGKELHD